jgi:hypothetical protein
MAYSFDPKAPFLGGIAGLNSPGSSGTPDSAFGGMLNVAPLTPGFTGAQAGASLPEGVDPNLGFLMNWQQQQQEQTRRESKQDLAEIMAQREKEFEKAATYKTLSQIPNTIASIGQGLAATLYNPASVEIASRTPGLLAGVYGQAIGSARQKYIS